MSLLDRYKSDVALPLNAMQATYWHFSLGQTYGTVVEVSYCPPTS